MMNLRFHQIGLRTTLRVALLSVWVCGGVACSQGVAEPPKKVDAGGDGGVVVDQLRCNLVIADPKSASGTRHLADGDEVELLKGYQGYLLVQVRAHFWGAVPRSVQLKLSGGKDGSDALVTVLPSRTPIDAADQHQRTDPLEIWLSPPDPVAFANRMGTLTLSAKGSGRSCLFSVNVRFVDRTYCVHYDDGSVACP